MVQNAKDYNAPKSDIYEDAERIRKLVYNFMKIHNPAYNDENYASFPTPLPPGGARAGAISGDGEQTSGRDRKSRSNEPSERRVKSVALKVSEPPARTASASLAPSNSNDEIEDLDFTGKTFQQAQEMLMMELIRHVDDEYALSPCGKSSCSKLIVCSVASKFLLHL